MPLSAGKSNLISQIESAIKASADAGAQPGASPESIINVLAAGLGDAIHKYMETAKVITVNTVNPGQTATPPPPLTGMGIYLSLIHI